VLAAHVSDYRALDPDREYLVLSGVMPSGPFHRRISFDYLARGSWDAEFTLPFLPRWLAPLWGLSRGSGPGIGSSIEEHSGREGLLDMSTLVKWIEVSGGYFYGMSADAISLPRHPIWPLQSSRYGDLFWVNETCTVWALDCETLSFTPVGCLRDFVRMCLCAFFEERDWFSDLYERNPNDWNLNAVAFS